MPAAALRSIPSPLALPCPLCLLQDVTQNWNDAWVEARAGDVRFFHALLGVTLAAYAGGWRRLQAAADEPRRACCRRCLTDAVCAELAGCALKRAGGNAYTSLLRSPAHLSPTLPASLPLLPSLLQAA